MFWGNRQSFENSSINLNLFKFILDTFRIMIPAKIYTLTECTKFPKNLMIPFTWWENYFRKKEQLNLTVASIIFMWKKCKSKYEIYEKKNHKLIHCSSKLNETIKLLLKHSQQASNVFFNYMSIIHRLSPPISGHLSTRWLTAGCYQYHRLFNENPVYLPPSWQLVFLSFIHCQHVSS